MGSLDFSRELVRDSSRSLLGNYSLQYTTWGGCGVKKEIKEILFWKKKKIKQMKFNRTIECHCMKGLLTKS